MTPPEELSAHPVLNIVALAYERVAPHAAALDPKKLAVFNVDVQYAVGIVLTKLPLLVALRDEMAALPHFELGALDELGHYAMALEFCHGQYRALNTRLDLSDARTEAQALRSRLKNDARALSGRGLLHAGLLAGLKNTTRDLDLSGDLMALHVAFTIDAAKLEGKCAVTAEEIERASLLAHQLLMAVTRTLEPRTETARALADERRRIFTLLQSAYGQVQRAIGYLRWDEGDAEHFAPSLYMRQSGKRRAPAKASTELPDQGAAGLR